MTMCYVSLVVDREYLWADEGLADARRNKLTIEEVIEALYAHPDSATNGDWATCC